MRHRTWSYNEISRRYTDFDIKFYEPKKFRTQHKSNRQASNLDNLINPHIAKYNDKANELLIKHHKASLDLFNDLMDAGICREQARGVLPQNMYTEYYGTVNLGNLLKFIGLRLAEGAQWEIQREAAALLTIAKGLWPATINSFIDHMESEEIKAKFLEN